MPCCLPLWCWGDEHHSRSCLQPFLPTFAPFRAELALAVGCQPCTFCLCLSSICLPLFMACSPPCLSFVPGCLSKMIFLIFPPSLLPGSPISLVVLGFTKAAQDRSALPFIKSPHSQSCPSQVSPRLVALCCVVPGVRLPQESSWHASPPRCPLAQSSASSRDRGGSTCGAFQTPPEGCGAQHQPSAPFPCHPPSRRGHKLTAGKKEPPFQGSSQARVADGHAKREGCSNVEIIEGYY